MRRILFVDDQAQILNGYKESLKKYAGQIEPLYALNGEAALETLGQDSVDVIVSDMHMPGMDGPMLLRTVKDKHPGVVRLMLGHPHDLDSAFFALLTVHQVLSKPLDFEALFNAIERTCRLRELLTDSLRDKIGAVGQLPPIPSVYLELTNAMTRPDVSNQKIARIIEKDAAMAAKTLQLVNSACFGLLRSVTTLENAIAYLGMDLIRDLSLTVHIFCGLEGTAVRSGFSFEAEQHHSLVTARIGKKLLPNRQQAHHAFTASLLHDLGKLVLAVCVPERYKEVRQLCKVSGRPEHEIEGEVLGFTHAEVGAYLLGLWGLPFPVIEAVAYHHNPTVALERNFGIPTAVSLANALVEEAMGDQPLAIVDHLEALGVTGKLEAWRAIARQEIENAIPESAVAK